MTYLPRLGRPLAVAVIAALLALTAGPSAYADATAQYIYISKQAPEHLYVIDGGRVLFESPVNTGIRQSPTSDGRFRIFASYLKRTMKGTDPRTGKKYNDKDVPYAMYFDGGKAIHGFYRRSYGYPQSFGCIELPVYKARELYQLLNGGTGTEVVVAQRRPQIQYAEREQRRAPSYSNTRSPDTSYPYSGDSNYPNYASDEYAQEAMPE